MSKRLFGLIIILLFLAIVLFINITYSIVKYASENSDNDTEENNIIINDYKYQDYESEYKQETYNIYADNDSNDLMMKKRNQPNNNENVIHISNMKLNEKYIIACPLNENLKFEYIVFNSSIYDVVESKNSIHQIKDYYYNDVTKKLIQLDSNLYLNLKSKKELNKLLYQTIHVSNSDFFIIDKVNALNSGRYYCIYSSQLKNEEYFVYGHLYLAYNGKFFSFIFKII
jgi:hypothetical protein